MPHALTAAARLSAAALITAAVTAAAASPAAAGRPPGPRAMSGTSPFTACTADSPDRFSAGAEVEGWVAVHPRDPRTIIVSWQQDRGLNGAARGIGTAVTHDGGRSWRRVVPQGITPCTGGPYSTAADAFVVHGPGRHAYMTMLSIGRESPPTTNILVSRSDDEGDSWNAPALLAADPMNVAFNDRPTVAVDRADPRVLHALWDRHGIPEDRHELLYARSADRGRTWSPPRVVYTPDQETAGTIGNQLAVLPDGTLVDIFVEGYFPIGGGRPEAPGLRKRVRVVRSADHGRTWSGPYDVADHTLNVPFMPRTGLPIYAPGIVPDIAVDPRTGTLYATWGEAALTRSGSAAGLAVSRDGGRTWTAPIAANRTPDSWPGGPGQAFLPQVDVSASGTVALMYYDLRNASADGPGTATDLWIALCRGASCATDPQAWRERHLAGPFNVETASPWEGYPYLGAYEGLAHTGREFLAAFAMTTAAPADPQNVYLARTPTSPAP